MFAKPSKTELEELYELGWEASDIPKDPKGELVSHVLRKGYQAGALVGLVAAPLFLRFGRGVPFGTPLLLESAHWALNAAGAFTLVSSGMLAYKWSGIDMPGFVDRAYRLRHNSGQRRTDQFSVAGMLVGGAGGLMLPGHGPTTGPLYRVAGCATLGCALGVLAHVGLSLVEQHGNGIANQPAKE